MRKIFLPILLTALAFAILPLVAAGDSGSVQQPGGWCGLHGNFTEGYNCPVCAAGTPGGERGPRGPTQKQLDAQAAGERRAKANGFNNAGIAAWNRGEWGIAKEQFRQAYAWNPDSKIIFTNLIDAIYKVGQDAMDKGEWEHAATMFQSLCYHKPDSKEFQRLQALARQKSSQQQQDCKLQRQADKLYGEAHAQYELGISASGKGDWATAERHFKAAAEIYPAESGFLKNVAWTKTKQGDHAWGKNDLDAALAFWESALKTDPENAYAREKVPQAQKYLAEMKGKAAAAGNVRDGLGAVAQELKNRPPADGLGFQDFDVEAKGGPLGGRPDVKVAVTPAPSHQAGTNTKAGDQLKSAAASSDLRTNYDIGGAPGAGSLNLHVAGGGPPALDISAFSERARKDPQLMALVQDVAKLQEKRRQLEADRAQLEKQRNLESDKAKMKDLSDLVAQKEKDYQANLKAIFDQTERAGRRKLVVDDEVEAVPLPQEPPKDARPPPGPIRDHT